MDSPIQSRTRKRRVGAALLAVAMVVVVLAVPQVRWRVHVIFLHLSGRIPDLELQELITFMLPGSDQSAAFLIDSRNPYAVFENTRISRADVDAGALIYQQHCLACHGPAGAGGPAAPAFASGRFKHGDSDWALYRAIRLGIANTAMQPNPSLSIVQRWQVISYVRSLNVSAKPAASAEVNRLSRINVPYTELKELREAGKDWLTYSGVYAATRHSSLAEINRENVHQLGVRWILQSEQAAGLEATPLVRDGIMFLSLPACSVFALDATTGEALWSYDCNTKTTAAGEVGGQNTRGVALLDDKVFLATWDSTLVALSAATGKELWRTTVAEDTDVYYLSSAPLAYRDLVVIGAGTRDVGRGFLAAFDANTGQERWRFHAIPAPGEPGNDTWEGSSWTKGGAALWLTGAYDPDEDLLYWNGGNPKPDYDTEARKGDNLYSNSLVALRGSSGELAWHFQFTPHDDKDWDANQMPVLIDRPQADGVQKLVLRANRNGFYYVFDRVSGKLISGTPFVQQNWAKGLDAAGRPIENDRQYGIEGELFYPGNVGGTNWWPPTYYPQRSLMIVPVLEQGMVYFSASGSPPNASGRPFYTAVRALDAVTGNVVWDYRREPRLVDNQIAGLASTAGGLVFGGDQAEFFALNADNGELLWSMQTGGYIRAAPMTYVADGEQFVAVLAGRDLIAFALPRSVRASTPVAIQ